VSVLFGFGLPRLLGEKGREIYHFSVIYLLVYVIFLIMFYYMQKHQDVAELITFGRYVKDALFVSALFFVPPTFVIAYCLYPFRLLKRSKILIWVLSVFSVLSIGLTALISIAAAIYMK
ncbi:MAG: hypothetical protein LBL42_07205, partial [Tannerella sp.]|nr:hypothetical protein [Tannerella sp.]